MEIDPESYDNHVEGGIYDDVVRQLMALLKGMSLEDATYKDDFIRDNNVNTGNFSYRAEYETILVGEIMPRPCGTKFGAIGNHYLGTASTPNVIDNRTRVKGVLTLGQPTQPTQMMYVNFSNQIATLDDIVQSDIKELKKQNKDINIKEWTTHAGTNQTGAPEFIMVNTEQLYAVPKGAQQAMQGKRPRVAKKAIANTNEGAESKSTDATANGSNKESTQESAITTNTFYEPTVLPDYGGDLFQHVNAKLHQLDIRNVENVLIPPQEWYTSLKRGTLVMIRATLHAFNWKEHRIYQINAHTICVMDPSKFEVEPFSSQPNGFDYDGGASSSKSRAADAMAGVQLGKRTREA
ncbi:uncharacterized protein EDB91DRAFT_1225736 [Suillus paluster]|uniref:uncharacterized protein n=1 Tax=Suillus paluster TaxID=48578 RepID=UPI001B866721|nr:uncharacterized protein EDB91DRAFT_1225736 [Suillus paluster]KAG1734242.1 hypothetical protein EDB91DRAFT_1225736 [Suillus paluster]